jgi:hypothetical protein
LFSRIDFFIHTGGTVTDERLARLRAHNNNNINRYRRLLKTNLSELERGFKAPWPIRKLVTRTKRGGGGWPML